MTFAEQLPLLPLGPKTGEFHALPRHSHSLPFGPARAFQRPLLSEAGCAHGEARFRQLGEMDLAGRSIIKTIRAARDKELLELDGQ